MCKQMSSGSFKKCYQQIIRFQIIYIYKLDLPLYIYIYIYINRIWHWITHKRMMCSETTKPKNAVIFFLFCFVLSFAFLKEFCHITVAVVIVFVIIVSTFHHTCTDSIQRRWSDSRSLYSRSPLSILFILITLLQGFNFSNWIVENRYH